MTPPIITEIDAAALTPGTREFGEALVKGLSETGFAVIRNHGIDQDSIDAMERESRNFFALPEARKTQWAMPDSHYQRGYSPFGTENAKDRKAPDLKEFWHVGRDTIPNIPGTPPVPDVPEFDGASTNLFAAMDEFARTLMISIGKVLGMSPARMDEALINGNSILRLLHYPPIAEEYRHGGPAVRAAAHEDINLLTLLLGAEEAGLEVKHRSGKWLAINPPAGALVVNAGDMLDRLTAGELPSTTHRVVNPAPERAIHSRYSMPFFLHPANDFLIEALPECVARGGVAQDPITARAFLDERLREIGLAKAKKA